MVPLRAPVENTHDAGGVSQVYHARVSLWSHVPSEDGRETVRRQVARTFVFHFLNRKNCYFVGLAHIDAFVDDLLNRKRTVVVGAPLPVTHFLLRRLQFVRFDYQSRRINYWGRAHSCPF